MNLSQPSALLCRLAGRWQGRAFPRTERCILQRAALRTMPAAAPASTAWQGAQSQEEFMLKDQCIVVDDADRIQGHANKYDSHRFNAEQPKGRLHRAFSVFLFDGRGRLLLQQRASSKITFPNVWTNTCCSHPLYGQQPDEVDTPADVATGCVPGVKRAAVRKLHQELGISPDSLPASSFKFLTRLHYCAPDSGTYGEAAPWGEHEVDYILLAHCGSSSGGSNGSSTSSSDGGGSSSSQDGSSGPVALDPNPDEVRDTRWVTSDELTAMMDPSTGLSWSPWFRIIAQHFLPRWWADLDGALSTNAHVDVGTIHRLECDSRPAQPP